jgi:hypothetical protein
MTGHEAETPAPANSSVSSVVTLHEGVIKRKDDQVLEIDMFSFPQVRVIGSGPNRRLQGADPDDPNNAPTEAGAEFHFRKALRHLATACAIAEELRSAEYQCVTDLAGTLAQIDPDSTIAEHWAAAQALYDAGVRPPA